MNLVLPVTIIIPTWNAADEIVACLDRALAQRCESLVVVDNASSDGTTELIRRYHPSVRLVSNQLNRGFAGACNQGFAESTSQAVLFLNSDALLEPDYVELLWQRLSDDTSAASATGKLVYDDKQKVRIDSAGIVLNRLRLSPEDRGLGELDVGQYDNDELIFGPSAAAALYRRDALSDICHDQERPFDESLFAYYEDVDLAWRLNRRGWRHWYLPRAVGWHRRRGPNGKPSSIRARAFANRYSVWLKNEPLWRFALYAPFATTWEAARLMKIGLRSPRDLTLFGAAGLRALLRRKIYPKEHA